MTEPQEPQKLQEYQYRVGHMVTTAQLTEEMAERMGAVPLGEELPDEDEIKNTESERLSSENAAALKGGVDGQDGESVPKSRTARNKRA